MPNGNIMAATGDRVVELSPEGDVVWEYRGLSEFERFAPDHSLFAEWDMTPKGRLADPGGAWRSPWTGRRGGRRPANQLTQSSKLTTELGNEEN